MREKDWSRTPLGPAEAWPQSLRTAINLILASPAANILVCGPERVLIYNDASIPLYGGKHPYAFGRTGAEAFPELWKEIGPLYDRVFAGESLSFEAQPWAFERGEASRNGLFDAWFTPVANEEGEVVCVHVMAFEVTARNQAREALRKSEERQAFLLGFSDALRAEPDADAVAERALRMVSEHLELDRCYTAIYRQTEDRAEITHQTGSEHVPPLPDTIPLSDFPAAFRQVFDRTLIIGDVAESADLSETDRNNIGALGMRALVAATLRQGERNPLWVLVAVSANPRRWTRGEIALVEQAAERTWEAMERARAEAALRENEERQTFLLGLGDVMRAQSSAQAIVEAAARLLGEHLGASRVLFAEFDEAKGVVDVFHGWFADGAQPFPEKMRLKDYEGPIMSDLRSGRTVRVEDARHASSDRPDIAAIAELGVKALLTVPLIVDGRLRANLSVHQHEACAWTHAETALVQEVAERVWADVVRARTEHALRESEARYRLLFDSIDQGFCVIEVIFDEQDQPVDYVFLQTNPAFLQQTGLRDAVGRSMRAMAPAHEAFWFEVYGRIARTGAPERFEHRADALNRWYEVYAFRVGEPRENRVAILFNDIRARKLAEEAVSDSEERLRLALQVSGLATWDWNIRTGEVEWSDEHYRMEGYEVGEIEPSYEAWAERVHPEDRPAAEAALNEARRTGETYNHAFRIVRPDGAVRWCAATGQFFHDRSGKACRMIGVMQDVTTQREWETRMQVMVEELQHRTRNLIGVVRAIGDQTLKGSGSLAEFRERFMDRLAALARVQGLLSRSDEEPVTIGRLVRMELDGMGADKADERIRLEGPEVRLRRSSVQTLALALHELATNACKYGALKTDDGRLVVTWRAARAEAGQALVLDWVEQNIQAVQEKDSPVHLGYGRTLIERALPYSLGANTEYELTEDEVRCRIELPLTRRGEDEVAG